MARVSNSKLQPSGIREIASRCNVSVSTVSHAFSGKRPVSQPLREKIFAAAKQEGYEPNQWAQNLIKGRTHVLGVLVDAFTNPFTAQWVTCLEEAAKVRGYRTWPVVTGGNKESAQEYLLQFRRMRLDGMVISTASVPDSQISELVGRGIPLATPARRVGKIKSTPVMVDFSDGIRQVLNYLHGLGHRDVAFMAGPREDPSSIDRLNSFLQNGRALGMKQDPALIVYGGEGLRRGEHEAEALLARKVKFTALVSSNDGMAFAAIGTLARHGLKVPDDVSVTGFDNVPNCDLWQPRLTSVAFDIQFMADQVIKQLVTQIETGAEMKTEQIIPKLVIRDSCGPANRDD